MKKNKGFTLAELLLAFAVCGVIFLISVQVFKSVDVRKAPYIYAVLSNLPTVNEEIMQDCYEDGSCPVKNMLPEDPKTYCMKLTEYFNITKDTNCTGSKETNELKRDNNAKIYDFTIPSGISFYGIHNSGGWQQIGSYPNKYIDIVIDINSDKGENKNNEDVFPIRIFQNGEIAPGVFYGQEAANFAFVNDPINFGYMVVSHKYVDNSLVSTVVDTRTETEKTNKVKFKNPISYRDALCYAYNKDKANDMIKRYYNVDSNVCGGTGYEQKPECQEATCTIEPIKPKGPGFVRLFGIE